jgi:S1-C subfamily serine protease
MIEQPEELPAQGISGRRPDLARVRARARGLGLFVAGVAATFLAIVLYGMVAPAKPPLTPEDVATTVEQALGSQQPGPNAAELAYAQVAPAIVYISVELSDAPGAASVPGVGTGVIIDRQGDILTALHVIESATQITLTFTDGTQSGAQIVGTRPESDIAVLRAIAPPASFTPATLGNPSVPIGSEAFVVGNPFGLYGSLSAGVVSGLNRTFQAPGSDRVVKGLIQVDAAVNPGSSGGPLLNRAGQVIGIVTGLINPNNENAFLGIGLAVPIDVAGGAAGLPNY